MNEQIILVNEQNRAIGISNKLIAHQQGLLHRAFSIFILRHQAEDTEVLLQQRQTSKYHCGGLWTNTCCGHPSPGESILKAAEKRLQQEMGFTTTLKEVGNFIYKADLDNGLIEHELDHVFIGRTQLSDFNINPQEAMAFRWVKLSQLTALIKAKPEDYTPWLHQATEIVLAHQ
ncbi:MAG: isopentenyl-diphosphate Delta-isomerase [Gammaproteobacteria bacterium]